MPYPPLLAAARRQATAVWRREDLFLDSDSRRTHRLAGTPYNNTFQKEFFMINLDERFNHYMGTDAPLERFRGVAGVLVESFLPPKGIFLFRAPGEEGGMVWKDQFQAYGFHILKKHWVTDRDIRNCGENDKNYFIHLDFKWSDGADEITLSIHHETYPYFSEKDLEKMGIDLPNSFIRLQEEFTDELHRRLRSSWKPANRRLQKAFCRISADSTINEVKEWFEAQSRIGERLIDETIERVLA
jgi:hypothetical protein